MVPITGAAPAVVAHTDKARAHRYPAQTIPTTVPTKVLLNVEDYDPGGTFDHTINYHYDVPTTGYYLICGAVHFASSGAGDRYPYIYVNGAERSRGVRIQAGGYNAVNIADVLYCLAGDFIELWCIQSSGGNLNTDYLPFIAVHRLS